MTVALVLATDPVADLPYHDGPNAPTLLQRLLGQLASLNVPDVRVLARPESAALLRKRLEAADGVTAEVVESASPAADLREIARLARDATEPLLVLPGDTVASGELLARLNGPRSDAATAVTAPRPGAQDGPGGAPVRVGGGRIVSAGTGFHQVTGPNRIFCGPLRVAPSRRVTLARAADRLAALLETPGALPGASGVPELLLVGLVRAGVRVTPLQAPPLVCARVRDAAQAGAARAAVDAVDEDRVRLDAAVKRDDGFFTTFAVSTYSRYIARLAARIGLTPNMVTTLSMALAVVTALVFAMGTRTGMVVGAVLYYFAFVLDCVDGQLARYTRRFSTFGAWLDATFDRAKEYTVFAGLAVGSTAAAAGGSVHGGDVWTLAVAAMALQTGRHMIDFAYGAANRARPAAPPPVIPLTSPGDGVAPAGPAPRPGGLVGLLRRAMARTGSGPAFWLKKMIVLPIGERFAVVSVTAALWNARVTFTVLLAWGAVAAAYTLTGRMLRSLTR